MAAPPALSPWSDLPHHILGLFVDRLVSSPAVAVAAVPEPVEEEDTARFRAAYRSHHTDAAADLARFRAVSRSCHAAVREQLPRPPRRLPWTVLIDGSFVTGSSASDDDTHLIPSWPKNATCIGATEDWLAIQCIVDEAGHSNKMHSTYHLHNPFSGATVPLPELDAVIGDTTKRFEVRKVLMRSNSPGDVVAVMTNNYNHPIILVRPGKGVWLPPRPRSAPFIYIIDIVFVGDKLYGITKAEDLISLDLAFDADDGKPTVTRTKRVIRHEPKTDDRSVMWGNADLNRVHANLSPLDNAYDLWSDVDEKYSRHEDVVEVKDEKDDETLLLEEDVNERARNNIRRYTGDDTIRDQTIDFEEANTNSDDIVATTCHILESRGKLLMVRRKLQWISEGKYIAPSADVFEANITTGAWMPVTAGLDGQAIFISRFSSKSIPACGEVVKDAVYFVDTGDVLSMKSRVISQPQRDLFYESSMWIFPPEIVV